MPLWPLSRRRLHLPPRPLRVVTGSIEEELVFVPLTMLALDLLLRAVFLRAPL